MTKQKLLQRLKICTNNYVTMSTTVGIIALHSRRGKILMSTLGTAN